MLTEVDLQSSVSPAPPSDVEKDDQFYRLKRMHLAAAVFMGVQVIAYAVTDASVSVKPTVGFPTTCEGPICEPDMRVIAERNPVFLITLFVALACGDHLVTWLVAHFRPEYARHWLFNVQSNPLR